MAWIGEVVGIDEQVQLIVCFEASGGVMHGNTSSSSRSTIMNSLHAARCQVPSRKDCVTCALHDTPAFLYFIEDEFILPGQGFPAVVSRVSFGNSADGVL